MADPLVMHPVVSDRLWDIAKANINMINQGNFGYPILVIPDNPEEAALIITADGKIKRLTDAKKKVLGKILENIGQ